MRRLERRNITDVSYPFQHMHAIPNSLMKDLAYCQTLCLQLVHLLHKVKMQNLRHDEIQKVLQSMDISLPLLENIHNDGIYLTEDEVISILMQAISAYFVNTSLKSLSTTANFVASNAFFLSSLCISQGLTSVANTKNNNEQLEPLLASWGMLRVPSLRNGDCLFRSIAYSLIYRMQRGDLCIQQCMARIGVPTEHMQNLDYIQRLLRMKMVQEWEENIDNYQGYISETSIL